MTIELSEKHKTIFSFKTFNKLNSFRINPLNRYSSGLSHCSGESNRLKRSETKEINGLGHSYKSMGQLNKSQGGVNRKFEKKYTTVFHKKKSIKMENTNDDKKNVERVPLKNNTSVKKSQNKDTNDDDVIKDE